MSLKEAVSALRSLKAELEASRRANAKLEGENRKLVENLRAADGKEGNSNTENGDFHGELDGEITPSEIPSLGKTPTETLGKELREAQEAASRSDELRKSLEDEARGLRVELAAVKTRLEESVTTANRELQEALAAKDEAIKAGELERARLEAAEVETERQEARAIAAEEQLSGATQDANILHSRLEELALELDSARTALSTASPGRAQGNTEQEREGPQGAGGDEEDVAELESELRMVRETVAGEAAIANGWADEVSSLRDSAEEARRRVDQLQAELDLATQETNELRGALQSARERQRAAEDSAAATAAVEAESLASERERLTEKEDEIKSLQARLELSEEALRETEKSIASIEASARQDASLKAAALEETKGQLEALKVAVADAVDAREKIERLAAKDGAARDGELSYLRESLETLRSEVVEAEARVDSAKKNAATMATANASLIAELESRLEATEADRDAALEDAASKVLQAQKRESESTAAWEAKVAEVEAAADARISDALKARDAAEKGAREEAARVSAGQELVSRLKAKAVQLKEGRAEAAKATREAHTERDAAVKAARAATAAREGVEETLLMANKELQRLKMKLDEAMSEAEAARAESRRLEAAFESSRAAAAARVVAAIDDTERGDTGGEERDNDDKDGSRVIGAARRDSHAEIMRLRKKIVELERSREVDLQGVVEAVGGGAEGRWQRSDDNHERKLETGEAESELEAECGDEEMDRLRAELRRAREEAAARAAGLETQLADKEREAADTQRRLYRRQSELEAELEEVRANHDALRVEMARMDASMLDAADSHTDLASSLSSTPSSGGRLDAKGGNSKEGGVHRKGIKDPAALGAEVGNAVGGIFRGKLWSGWGSAGGVRDGEEQEEGQHPDVVKARRLDRRAGRARARVDEADATREEVKEQQSISRVRDTMMARLHEAASQPVPSEGMGEEEEKGKEGEEAEEKSGEDDASAGAEIAENRAGAEETTASKDGWVEETVEHPAPDYGLSSPVIRYLLQQWSSDPEKLRYLSLWLRCVVERRKVPDAFPSGLQLVGLAPEIKDGFLTLVVPIIRHSGRVPVIVHSRRSSPEENASYGHTITRGDLWDLRVKVDLQGNVELPSGRFGDGSRNSSGLSSRGAVRKGARRGDGGALGGRIENQLSTIQEKGGNAKTRR